MRNSLTSVCLVAGMALTTVPAHANSLVAGSIDAGKARSVTCAACHGQEGNSANVLWPNIAGQNALYLLQQLEAFKSGDRVDPLMSGQAMSLSDQDMRNLAVYYESLSAPAMPVADPDKLPTGRALYRGGDNNGDVAACAACHGPTGRGNPAARYPALNGQHATYTAKQLRDYASGARKSDGRTRIMRTIAARLSDDDIVALASYIQGLK